MWSVTCVHFKTLPYIYGIFIFNTRSYPIPLDENFFLSKDTLINKLFRNQILKINHIYIDHCF